jgi:hypothetical protein
VQRYDNDNGSAGRSSILICVSQGAYAEGSYDMVVDKLARSAILTISQKCALVLLVKVSNILPSPHQRSQWLAILSMPICPDTKVWEKLPKSETSSQL